MQNKWGNIVPGMRGVELCICPLHMWVGPEIVRTMKAQSPFWNSLKLLKAYEEQKDCQFQKKKKKKQGRKEIAHILF